MKSPLLSEDAIYRILRDLLRAELRRMRGTWDSDADFPQNTVFPDAPWHTDSMEIMEMAAAVTEFFHLHKSGLEDNLLRFKKMGQWIETVAISRKHFPEEITFRTSGSTGEPLPRSHRMEDMMQEIRELAGIFKNRKRILSFVPAHHIYGFLFTVLLPAEMGIEVRDGRDTGTGIPAAGIRPGDLLISFPAHWSFLERSLAGLPEDVEGVSSTAPMPPQLIRRIAEKGISRFSEIYGSSAHGGIGYRHKTGQPFRLFSYLHPAAFPADENTLLVRTYPNGKPRVFPAEDLLEWEDEKHFYVRCRRDGAVQVGGINVYPETVAEKIRAHPLVADCAVRLMKDREIPRLKAFIVPETDREKDILIRELRGWMQQHLHTAEIPLHLRLGEKLPRNEMGKNRDWRTD